MAYTKEQREKKKAEVGNANTHETENIKNIDTNENIISESKEEKIVPKYFVKKDLPLTTMVPCKSNVYGSLVYVSVKTNERHEWDEIGDVEYIELGELITMKNSQKSFFVKNWILIDDIEILDFLGVKKFYEKAIDCKAIDKMFKESAEQITSRISGMTDGMKNTVALRARQKISEGILDSISTIKLLEKLLNVELIEH